MTELLELLREGRAWSVEALADRLGESPAAVKRDIDFLARTGYLRPAGGCGGCGGSCGGKSCQSCASATAGLAGMPVLWEPADPGA